MHPWARPGAGRKAASRRVLFGHGLSFVVHAGLLGAAAAVTPWTAPPEEPAYSVESAYLLGSYLVTAAEHELDARDFHDVAGTPALNEGNGVRPTDEADGRLGSIESEREEGRLATWGYLYNEEPGITARGGTWMYPFGPVAQGVEGDAEGLGRWREPPGAARWNAEGHLSGRTPDNAMGLAGTAPAGADIGGRAPVCAPGRKVGMAGPGRVLWKGTAAGGTGGRTAGIHPVSTGGSSGRRKTSGRVWEPSITDCEVAQMR